MADRILTHLGRLHLLLEQDGADEARSHNEALASEMGCALSLLQGICLTDYTSKRLCSVRSALEVRNTDAPPNLTLQLLLAVIDAPYNQGAKEGSPFVLLASHALDTLMCILVDASPETCGVFEHAGGLSVVRRVMRAHPSTVPDTARERNSMHGFDVTGAKCYEFLLFYLQTQSFEDQAAKSEHQNTLREELFATDREKQPHLGQPFETPRRSGPSGAAHLREHASVLTPHAAAVFSRQDSAGTSATSAPRRSPARQPSPTRQLYTPRQPSSARSSRQGHPLPPVPPAKDVPPTHLGVETPRRHNEAQPDLVTPRARRERPAGLVIPSARHPRAALHPEVPPVYTPRHADTPQEVFSTPSEHPQRTPLSARLTRRSYSPQKDWRMYEGATPSRPHEPRPDPGRRGDGPRW